MTSPLGRVPALTCTGSGARPEGIRIVARAANAGAGNREIGVEALARAIDDGELLWIDILHPTPIARRVLGDLLDLDPLTIENSLLPLRMPKLDPLPDGGTFVAAFGVRLDEGDEPRLRAYPVAMVITSHFLLTIRRDESTDFTAQVEAVLRAYDPDLREPVGAALAHAVIDVLVDRHLPVMVRAAEVGEELEEWLDPSSERRSIEAIERLIVLRRDLLAFRRLGVAQQEVIRRLSRRYPSVRAHFIDVADDQREAMDTAVATCDYIDGAIEAYRLRRDVRTQDGIRRLTVLAGMFAPLSLLIGLWSVNFPNIPGTQSPWGWFVFVLAQVCFIVIAGAYFRRRGLL
jgi:magnesium transporter